MEAPEKIYIHPTLDNLYGMCERSCDSEIEYVRKDIVNSMLEMAMRPTKFEVRRDIFIENICEKLKKCMYDNLTFQGRLLHREEIVDNFIEYFKNYIKEE